MSASRLHVTQTNSKRESVHIANAPGICETEHTQRLTRAVSTPGLDLIIPKHKHARRYFNMQPKKKYTTRLLFARQWSSNVYFGMFLDGFSEECVCMRRWTSAAYETISESLCTVQCVCVIKFSLIIPPMSLSIYVFGRVHKLGYTE